MKNPFKLNVIYLVFTIILFTIEILIAKFAHDEIIRPYIGDLLVVILIYCFVKSLLNTPFFYTAIAVLIFSYLVETLQYFDIVTKLGLAHSKFARIIIGTSFAWIDMAAYTVGIAIVIGIELFMNNKKNAKHILIITA